MKQVAILITCHNRRELTLSCLKAISNQQGLEDISCDVFVVDDGSTDGTSQAITQQFPDVYLIHGNGKLFWNLGMRLAWTTASSKLAYDFYIWLNDDTFLYSLAIKTLLTCYQTSYETNKDSIIVGCIQDPENFETSYGGYWNDIKLSPNQTLQECMTFNGNLVLIPKAVFLTIGNLSKNFTHGFGDTEYGWRARQAGFKCFVSNVYLGVAQPNPQSSAWADPGISLKNRIRIFMGPKGLPPIEWYHYSRKIYGWKWPISFLKVTLRLIFPKAWLKLKNFKPQAGK